MILGIVNNQSINEHFEVTLFGMEKMKCRVGEGIKQEKGEYMKEGEKAIYTQGTGKSVHFNEGLL